MRRGCISLGNISCDECGCNIAYPERYICILEEKGKEKRLCHNCSRDKGLIRPGSEKDEAEFLFNLESE
jgi:hypothetical protein